MTNFVPAPTPPMRILRPIPLVVLATLLGAAVPSILGAQLPLREVDATRLRMGTDSLAIYLVRDGDTVQTGMVYDELRTGTGSPHALQRVYRTMDRVLGIRLDSIADEWPTLAPMSHRSRSDQSLEFYRFSDGRARGWMRLANGDSVDVDAAVPAGTFNASSVDLVLRSAPLAAGWIAEVHAFLPNSRTVVPLRARVAGSDSIAGYDAWRVVVDFAGLAVTFWIAKDSRALLQQQMQLRPGVSVLFMQPRTAALLDRTG